jgi:hypothetical protein
LERALGINSRIRTVEGGWPTFALCCWEANADNQELCGIEKPRMKAFHDLAFSHFLDVFPLDSFQNL